MKIWTMSTRLVLFAFVVFTVVPVSAQSPRASVRGLVVDPTGAAIPQVSLQITNEATGELRTSVTGGDGRFAVTTLPPGTYKIDVEQPGYKKYVSQTELQINQEFWLEIRLELGNLSEEVVVTTPVVPLDKESAALGTVIDARQLAGLLSTAGTFWSFHFSSQAPLLRRRARPARFAATSP